MKSLSKFVAPVLLAFAIAALPALSHASSINPAASMAITSGVFVSGTVTGTIASGNTVTVQIVGSLGTFTLTTSTLSAFGPFLLFNTGTVTVVTPSGTFSNSVFDGLVQISGTGSFTFSSFLTPTATLTSGTSNFGITGLTGGVIGEGTAGLTFEGTLTPVPEPGALGFLGSGLLGLAGLVTTRKLKVGKLVQILAA